MQRVIRIRDYGLGIQGGGRLGLPGPVMTEGQESLSPAFFLVSLQFEYF